ncbi:MAG: hypothetical protein GYA55_09975 [SAR324 cluster bacterium]|uniref:Uncharacterized protein n=1 Tax=SAR324 cluster bacterium TaxID=2024889 RepID=A0A7X9IKU4_9DELT|nr:hypothetical protein [SAR324 cluster bacterium]
MSANLRDTGKVQNFGRRNHRGSSQFNLKNLGLFTATGVLGCSLLSGMFHGGRRIFEGVQERIQGSVSINLQELKRRSFGIEGLNALMESAKNDPIGRLRELKEGARAIQETNLLLSNISISDIKVLGAIKNKGGSIGQPDPDERGNVIEKIKEGKAKFNGYGTDNNEWLVTSEIQMVVVSCSIKMSAAKAVDTVIVLTPNDFKTLLGTIENPLPEIANTTWNMEGNLTTISEIQKRLKEKLDTKVLGDIVADSATNPFSKKTESLIDPKKVVFCVNKLEALK